MSVPIYKINKALEAGNIPDELNFNNFKPNSVSIDLEKLKYNAFYRDYSFYENKFPKGHNTIPGFDKIIESIREKNEDNTPLKEIHKKLNDE